MNCVLSEFRFHFLLKNWLVQPQRQFCYSHRSNHKLLKWLCIRNYTKTNCRGYRKTFQRNYTNVELRYSEVGQPTYVSHPHVLKKGEITPSITLSEFQERRSRLLELIESCSPKKELHIVVIPSSPKKYMTEKIPYVFRQNSDFLYLTGCLEPDSVLVLTSYNKRHESVLCLRGKDPNAELWDGPRTGFEQAIKLFGVDRSLPFNELSGYLSHTMKRTSSFSLWFDVMGSAHDDVLAAVKDTLPDSKMCDSPRPLVHKLRLFKSPAEQNLMRRTCHIGSEAIRRTMQFSKPGCSEAQIFARVDFESRMLGAQFLAYPPVVAGGPRANIIHYINNNQLVEPGDLVLMDAGCDFHGYSSDITRTWPISGKYSPEQRLLYDVLLQVQEELIKETEQRPNLNDLFHSMCLKLGTRLREAGVISSKISSDEELSRAAFSLCPHHVGHYLGMDIHDTSTIARNIQLAPGMVFTVEPGIYINSTNKFANPRFHGLGMRIEDDILITETGVEALTAPCPKHPDDIETLLKKKPAVN